MMSTSAGGCNKPAFGSALRPGLSSGIIAGKTVSTWAFGDTPSAGGLHVSAGDMLEATFVNKLPSHNTVHWHGLALRNDMDGVHDLTMGSVEAGGQFTYRFTVPDPGTYWFHPHMGLELDRGLYAPLIVEDPHEPLAYDLDVTLMLDDWLDGFGRTPEEVLAEMKKTGGHAHNMGNMAGMGDMSGMSGMGNMGSTDTTAMAGMSGMDPYAGDVVYPHHLINGRAANDRQTIEAKPGQKVRIRIINAASDTAYRFGIAGHQLTVTHADGFPVEHVTVDHLMIGMGERYDVLVTAGDGAFPIIAAPEGKADPYAEAVLRTNTDASPAAGSWPAELDGKGLSYSMLRTTQPLAARQPDRSETIMLTVGSHYVHGINGASFPNSTPVVVHQGERLRLVVMNHTMMFHPIHLHGHTFQLASGGAVFDAITVYPKVGYRILDWLEGHELAEGVGGGVTATRTFGAPSASPSTATSARMIRGDSRHSCAAGCSSPMTPATPSPTMRAERPG